LIALLISSAFAQESSPPRTDPGTSPESNGGTSGGWEILQIPGLPANATLGDVWASADGHVYVWARYPSREGTQPAGLEEPGEGERLPNPGGNSKSWSSTLYRFDGTLWTVALRASGESGVAVLGTDCHHLFASTIGAQGEANLYSFDGTRWTREVMPELVLGRLHTLVGVPGDLYFRVDRKILHHDGARLEKIFELPVEETPTRGMVYLGADGLFVMDADCHWLYDMGTWREVAAGFAFADVEDAWGMRDVNGRLQMYALGANAPDNGLQLWRFDEANAVSHAGTWTPVFSDPSGVGAAGAGSGLHLWGAAGNDVYATGVVEGLGHMLRFDGTAWVHLAPPIDLATVHGVWGTPQGVVWFSVESGSLVRYQRTNRAPDLSAAGPSVDRLWPDDRQLVRVDVRGIVDPDGDAVTIAIDRVMQDEDPISAFLPITCPDAVLSGDHAFVRAEHAPNGDGRTYVIEYTATDRLGVSSRGQVEVCAPHYATTACTPDPGTYDATAMCPTPEPERDPPLDADAMRGALRVHYQLDQPGRIHLGVYDIAGRLRGTIAEGVQERGDHETTWDLGNLESGVYFVKLRAHGPALVRRVILTR
jgi:hypothetical protein